jgi:hypothetical protein
VKFLRSRRGLAALAVLILILVLFRPGVYRFRQRIAGSIGSALGRRVSLDNVRFHILPRPGFDLEGLVIYDDPAFSAEPMVRAQEVSAAIRFRSLFVGRLEIARLSAAEPSINLVRNAEGRWNLASLIERNSHIPASPTGIPGSARRPAFPYLEAANARINFKIGQAKKSWALTDAEVSLWQDGENSWGARMKAQPIRTDFNLTDTGIIQVNANWQRSANLPDTPLQIALQWQNGQLGQVTKLLSGGDRGWRGAVNIAANLSGSPRSLALRSQFRIDDFRRYDIMGTGVLLSANCDGHYSTDDAMLSDLDCESAAGGGNVRVRGTVGPITPAPNYDLTFSADRVPISSLLQLARQVKKGLPGDLVAVGNVSLDAHAVRVQSGDAQLTGEGTAAGMRLTANSGKDEIVFGDVPLRVGTVRVQPKRASASKNDDGPPEPHVNIGPFPLGIGGLAPATASGWVSASGYRFGLRGDADVAASYRLSNAIGIAGFHPVAEGEARLDLNVSGAWQGFAAPQAVGTALLKNVRTGMRGLNPEINIASASMKLEPDTVSFEKIDAQTGDTRWNGMVRAPRHCGPEGCVFDFDLAADQITSDSIADWFTPRPAKRPWYRILAATDPQGKSPLQAVHARGKLRVNRLTLKKVQASQIVSQIEVSGGTIALTGLRAQLLDGTHQGDWKIDASQLPAHFQGSGNLQNVSMAQVSQAMNDEWATGTVDGKFALTTSGDKFADLIAQCDGELHFSARNVTLPHLEIPDSTRPLVVRLFMGALNMKSGTWKLSAGRLESQEGVYEVSGTALPAKGLNILLTRGDEQAWIVTGTLAKPVAARADHTEARAK